MERGYRGIERRRVRIVVIPVERSGQVSVNPMHHNGPGIIFTLLIPHR